LLKPIEHGLLNLKVKTLFIDKFIWLLNPKLS